MCKDTISVDWQGNLYDCDFNQQLGLKANFSHINLSDLANQNLTLIVSIGCMITASTAPAKGLKIIRLYFSLLSSINILFYEPSAALGPEPVVLTWTRAPLCITFNFKKFLALI